jgi:hypothetical protein
LGSHCSTHLVHGIERADAAGASMSHSRSEAPLDDLLTHVNTLIKVSSHNINEQNELVRLSGRTCK